MIVLTEDTSGVRRGPLNGEKSTIPFSPSTIRGFLTDISLDTYTFRVVSIPCSSPSPKRP
ncbi:hypothetical protein PRIPAC_97984 [Pristionchus pacificus]|nr:hypothetical protein PRIPAC_97984 [Pristionchus pacificus]